MPYDVDGNWFDDFTSGTDWTVGGNNPSAYTAGTDAPVNYTYDSIVPSGVNLGSLGGIQSTSSGVDWGNLASTILGKAATPGGIAALAAGLYSTLGGGNKPSGSPGWKGQIDPNAMKATRTAIAQPAYTPYGGQPVMGRRHFTDVEYTKKAAEGGLMELAAGGHAKQPRYLRGATDGMADEISTSIDGDQPAALSHGEFVVPADVVGHLGNGNSEAGAQVLYKMMDRVRQARTGNKKQGKQINPEKFTPGGIAGYAGGGVVAFADGGSTSAESNLSSWAGPGIADYIQKGTALSQTPYEAYTGPLTAGASPLQQQAFATAGSLQPSAYLGQAAQIAGDAANKMGGLSYSPTGATNQYAGTSPYQAANIGNQYQSTSPYVGATATNQYVGTSPYQAANIGNQYQSTSPYQAASFTNQYTGTSPYTSSNITTGQFGTAQAQQYMNPYLQASLDPQLEEARRQSQITQMGNAAKATQAGAYGGGRSAIMDAETQRNLGTNLANITGQGYNTAYANAMQQYTTDQARQLQAQQINEASRQFGAGQALTNAQQAAQYGQQAQSATEASRQFGAQQALTNAQQAAQYGLAGLNATEASRQFGAGQALTNAQQAAQYGQQAQAQNMQERQFGAQQALTNAQQAAQYGLAGLNATEASRQFGAGQALTNAQQAAQYGQQAQAQNMQQQQFGANYGLQALQGQLGAAQALGGFGAQQSATGIANLNAQLGAGATQRGIEQEGLTALKAQFEEERQNPYKQVQFAQSLYQGLPVSTTTASTATSPLQNFSAIGSGMAGIYDQINKLVGP